MMTACPSNHTPPHAARLHPFGIIHQIGLSQTSLARLDRYRRKRERAGPVMAVLSWPDGTWCALALNAGQLAAVVLGDGQKASAYREARSLIGRECLPLLTLRFGSNP